MKADKIYHFVAGLVIAAAVANFAGVNIGFLAAIAVGLLKELYDYADNKRLIHKGLPTKHDVSALDLAATVVGGFVGTLIYYVSTHV